MQSTVHKKRFVFSVLSLNHDDKGQWKRLFCVYRQKKYKQRVSSEDHGDDFLQSALNPGLEVRAWARDETGT